MLSAYLNAKMIRLQVEAADWQEAVRIAGNLLVETGKCEPRYIDAMIAAVHELGPYMVLAPGLALAHARPEDGVLEMGISLITLNPPVAFGSDANDPVSIVIAFGGVDKESHIGLLAELARFLEDRQRRASLSRAENIESVLQAIENF